MERDIHLIDHEASTVLYYYMVKGNTTGVLFCIPSVGVVLFL